jgi:16S rRNA (guanine966-N2)-methyltransferase
MTGSFSPARNPFMPLRVIAGQLRGKKLATVPGRETRPTADRIRESIFNILGTAVRHAHVLDLFAGTGAFGIEALSRGADFALFIENGREALGVLTRNIQACRLADRTRVLNGDAAGSLNGLAGGDRKFDLVFMDPPYRTGMIAPALRHLADSRCLADKARIVVEHAAGEAVGEAPPFHLQDHRCYGKTLVSFLTCVL